MYIHCCSKVFKVVERSFLYSPKLHLFDQKYSKNSNIVKYYYKNCLNISYIVIYSYADKTELAVITPVFSLMMKLVRLLLLADQYSGD